MKITTLLFDFSNVLYLPGRGLDDELLLYLEGIKDRVELAIFTSLPALSLAPARPRLSPIFSQILSSVELGYRKDDPRAYTEVAQRLGKKPEEILFIDDEEARVAAARHAGLHGVRYADAETLIRWLEREISSTQTN